MKKRRLIGIFLLLFLFLTKHSIFVWAAEEVFSVKTDKTEYSTKEPITEIVEIHNGSKERMTDIVISGNIPQGYSTKEGVSESGRWSVEVEKADPEEMSEYRIQFFSQSSQTSWEENAKDKQEAEDTKKGAPSPQSQSLSTKAKASVSTGDREERVLWLALVILSLSMIAIMVGRRKGRRIFSCFLAVAAASALLITPFTAKAEADAALGAESRTFVNKIWIDGREVELETTITYQTEKKEENKEESKRTDLSYEGYSLKWKEEFEDDSLNRQDWNVELHDPGWVNNELQSYVDSNANIYLKDGSLVLKPLEERNQEGRVTHTSGRINTQHKHEFKYGLFEARLKVPKGQGFLPAFWMMPANENLYGQWPRCGEIDIMEVLGNKTDTSYGTIHYGNPHSESQGSHTLDEGDFSEEYHVFDVEWEPGKIKWYVDGKRIHTEDDWYSATEGQGEITYPAPFDQPFYIILNLAVGGNWPGNPDDTTDIANAAYYVDYVRVYQKDSYDENVVKPEKEVDLRPADEKGNYIVNGDFSVNEQLEDEKDWIFLRALGGKADAEIRSNEIAIRTQDGGKADYSVQLVQPNLPMKKGGVYRLSFDAYAEADRTMKVTISAPDRGFRRYLKDTEISLSGEKKTYTLSFTMQDKDDTNGRLEFNMGAADSEAGIIISNVTLEKTGEAFIGDEEKGVLSDGNYVYNGSFQEGKDRLGYWEILKNEGAEVRVTNEDNVRRLLVKAPENTSAENPIIVSQSDLALVSGNTYAMSFWAEAAAGSSIRIKAVGKDYRVSMGAEEQEYTYKLTLDEEADRALSFIFEEPGIYYIDNVRIEEDRLIKNGSFNAGFSGYEPYVDSSISSDVSYVVDSLNEDNAADFTINNTGDAAWKIQLKQNNVPLEKGQWYRLSLHAKASIERKIMFALQRDGSADNDWTPYSGEKVVELKNDYENYELVFQMTGETDPKTILSISMGAVGGEQIGEKHCICIDNIQLEKIEEEDVQ